MIIKENKPSGEDIVYNDFSTITIKSCTFTASTTLFDEDEINSTDYVEKEPVHFFILDSMAYYEDPYHDFCYKTYELLKTPFDHYINWWDWFRTGKFQQPCKKKKVFTQRFFCKNNFWRKILPHKSGYVGKAMKRRKGR